MKQKELTEKFILISNWKPFGLFEYISALSIIKFSTYYNIFNYNYTDNNLKFKYILSTLLTEIMI